MRQQICSLVDALRVSAAARWTRVSQVRLQTRAVLGEFRARRRGRNAHGSAPQGDDADWLETEVLRVITRHPEGVRAFDIGNEIGIDWRCVPAVAGRLVERAIVEQIAQQFYPVKKAS